MTPDLPSAHKDNLHILLFAPHLLDAPARSGIHRVAARLVETLPACATVDFVKWDPIEGQLRYWDRTDILRFAQGTRWTPPFGINPAAHRVDYCFADTLGSDEHVVLLMPEVFFLIENGNEIYARLLAQSGVHGWTTAAIFYDLIPLTVPGYNEENRAFARYLAELSRVDLVLPISRYSEDQLREHWTRSLGLDANRLAETEQKIVTVPLADKERDGVLPPASERKTILLLGTIEPRKQQTRVIRAFQKLRIAERTGLSLVVIGGLNPRSEAEFRALIADDPSIRYRGYATDAEIDAAFAEARFSVFASFEEGFGLPIVESLSRNVPCLTSDKGAMREAAEGGGCILIDVETDSAIEQALELLVSNDAVLERCRREIADRQWRTWPEYTQGIAEALQRYTSRRDRAQGVACVAVRELVRTFYEKRKSPAGSDAYQTATLSEVRVDRLECSPDLASFAEQLPYRIAALAPQANPDHLNDGQLKSLVSADAWFCYGRATYERVVERARSSKRHGLLSGVCAFDENVERLSAEMTRRLTDFFTQRSASYVAARRDEIYRIANSKLERTPAPLLSLVISSYNRADFIERSIAHCLALIEPLGGRVQLLVVDNASTDETCRLVEPFAAKGKLELVRITCNTGLLGNLHHVSTLIRARHVWTIGVDDIIPYGAPERILSVLERDPTCPFILPNFAVYHREAIGPHESCTKLLSESVPVGRSDRPDGMVDVVEAASQHDNLLTAFYIIIFRSDLMSAVFNSPFTDPFFGSLYDTVPTTSVIFSSMSNYRAAWLREPVIVGNGHNTWRHHRVKWHGILMPLAFELAREAGLDPRLLKTWAAHHVGLLREAEELYPDENASASFSPDELEAGFRLLGKPIDEPQAASSAMQKVA